MSLSLPKCANQSTTFYCFTPLVSLVTFALETGAALYCWLRYRATPLGRVLSLQLFLFGLFQLGEYAVCGLGAQYLWLMRLGLVAATFLPPTALHAINLAAGKRYGIKTAYASAIVIGLFIIVESSVLPGVICPGRYVIFDVPVLYGMVHLAFYWITSLGAFLIAARALYHKQGNAHLVRWLVLGYFAAILPILFLGVIYSWNFQGYGSIYCGFALFTSFIFMWKVLPHLAKP